jgi:hypothetical protein
MPVKLFNGFLKTDDMSLPLNYTYIIIIQIRLQSSWYNNNNNNNNKSLILIENDLTCSTYTLYQDENISKLPCTK